MHIEKKYKSASIHSRNQSNKMQGRESIPAKSTAQNPTNQTEVKLGPLHLIHPNPKPISLNHPRYPPLTRPQHLPHHQVQVRGGGGTTTISQPPKNPKTPGTAGRIERPNWNQIGPARATTEQLGFRPGGTDREGGEGRGDGGGLSWGGTFGDLRRWWRGVDGEAAAEVGIGAVRSGGHGGGGGGGENPSWEVCEREDGKRRRASEGEESVLPQARIKKPAARTACRVSSRRGSFSPKPLTFVELSFTNVQDGR